MEKTVQFENLLKQREMEKEQKEEELSEMNNKVKIAQQEFDDLQDNVTEANTKLEETEKRATIAEAEAEAEVAAMTRRIRLLEEDFEVSNSRLTEVLFKLEETSKSADESERVRKCLETRSIADDERLSQLEDQLKEAKYIAEDADRKYDEAARKLAITEVDFERAESRLESAESI
ncbi:unnamed protein product [Protopolystoma xenopodis]|uniref:Tropomyosin n=1 Tax=Protopolystoma xenopodis TaxID=117903 RepID=A0A3S5BBL6_9PLAT|nr:unnamed protein product [Protopolystoma xenopodis]